MTSALSKMLAQGCTLYRKGDEQRIKLPQNTKPSDLGLKVIGQAKPNNTDVEGCAKKRSIVLIYQKNPDNGQEYFRDSNYNRFAFSESIQEVGTGEPATSCISQFFSKIRKCVAYIFEVLSGYLCCCFKTKLEDEDEYVDLTEAYQFSSFPACPTLPTTDELSRQSKRAERIEATKKRIEATKKRIEATKKRIEATKKWDADLTEKVRRVDNEGVAEEF